MVHQMGFIKFLFVLYHITDAYVIMSVDAGSRYVKNAIIKSGYQPVTVYDDFGRKFSSAVSVSARRGFIGDDAIRELAKNPTDTFLFFIDLLTDDPAYQSTWSNMFPNRTYITDSHTFIDSRNEQHKLEEFLAMLLSHSAKRTIEFAEKESIDACVLALPSFYNYNHRHAMMTIAETAGVKVTALVPSNVAAAFHFGLFQTSEYKRNPMNILIVDIGAANTQMSVFQLSHRKQEDSDFPVPSLMTLSHGYNRTLGAWRFQYAVIKSLIEQIENKVKFDYNSKAMAKLFIQSESILKRLGTDERVNIIMDNLYNGLDFEFSITRDDIENRTIDILEQTEVLAERVLKEANLKADQISQVIASGGGSRIIWLEKRICNFLNRSSLKFDRRINVDEGIALGAVYYGSSHSTFFRTPKFIIKDKLSFTVKVIVPPTSNDGNETEITLFTEGSLYPKRKTLSFKNREKDFDVKFEIIENNTTSARKTVSLKGIESVIAGHSSGTSYHGVRMTVSVDMSQILRIENAEYRLSTVETPGGLTGLKNKLFETLGLGHAANASAEGNKDHTIKDEAKMNASETVENSTKFNKSDMVTSKPKAIMHSIPLQFEMSDSFADSKPLLALIKKRLTDYENAEAIQKRREKLQNDMESWFFVWSDETTMSEFSAFIKQSEKEAIVNATNLHREWFGEHGNDASIKELEERMFKLQLLVQPIENRMEEQRKRKASLQFIDTIFNVTAKFLNDSINFTQENETTPRTKPLIREEVNQLENKYNDSKSWLEEMLNKEKNRSLSDDPVLLASEIDARILKLSKKLERLSNKVRYFKPPPPTVKVNITKLNKSEDVIEFLDSHPSQVNISNETVNQTSGNFDDKSHHRDEL